MEWLGTLIVGLLSPLPLLVVLWVCVRHGPFRNRWWRGENLLGFALTVGGLCFAAGFFGPIVFTPDANQGPLLGIFITGPLGFALGLIWGSVRAARRKRAA